MSRQKSKRMRLPNGFGRITEIKGKNLRNPFRSMVTVSKDEFGKPIGGILGYHPTYNEAYQALMDYHKNPYSLEKGIELRKLYEEWSNVYYKTLSSISSVRTVTAAWEYVDLSIRKMQVTEIRIAQIKGCIENAKRIDEKGITIIATDGTKSRMKSMFNLMFDFACEKEVIEINYSRQFHLKGIQGKIEKTRHDKNPFTMMQEEMMWSDLDYGYTRMIIINNYSTWRPQELVKLERANIDLENSIMIGGLKTEAGTNRIVPIHPKIYDLVKYYYDRSEGKEFLFNDYDGKNVSTMSYDKYRGRFKKVMDRHSLTDFSPSCPRHTFATRAKEVNMSDMARKLLMGHEIYDTTDKHYTHMDLDKWLMEELIKIK